MNNQQIEFLDLLAIVSFALQMEFLEEMQHQTTNDDIIAHLHNDLVVVDKKLNAIIKHLGISLPDVYYPCRRYTCPETS